MASQSELQFNSDFKNHATVRMYGTVVTIPRDPCTDRSDRSDNFDYNKNGYTIILVLLDLLMRTV